VEILFALPLRAKRIGAESGKRDSKKAQALRFIKLLLNKSAILSETKI